MALPALAVVAAGVAVVAWAGARITEALTDDPDQAPGTAALPLYAGLAVAAIAVWALARRR